MMRQLHSGGEDQSRREEFNDYKVFEPCSIFTHNPRNPLQEREPYDPLDWVPAHSLDSEYDWCRTPSTEEEDHSTSPTSAYSAQSPKDNPRSDSIKLSIIEEDLRQALAREQEQSLVIKTQGEVINTLEIAHDDERCRANLLGAKLFDLFAVVTQNQQYELDKLQKRFLELQADAEHCLLSSEWDDLQRLLHYLNNKLDGYLIRSTHRTISTGEQTDELTLFLSNMAVEIQRIWNRLEKLACNIKEKMARKSEQELQGGELVLDRPADEQTSRADELGAEGFANLSVTSVLNRYYDFSRIQRERFVARGEKLQALLNKTSTELGRLQSDLVYEKGRTANIKTRMMFWADDLEVSKVKCATKLMENLKAKELALQRGWEELERVADIMQKLPSYFHVIDIRTPEEGRLASAHPIYPITEAQKVSKTRDCAGAASQVGDKLYIAELEAKLREKQADEKAWAAHLENLHQREKETKSALEGCLNSIVLGNEELRKVVKMIAGKLFEHRERFWGFSTPARKLGEELISTLEQVDITCDDPLVYE
ncbi:hypothetical protein HD806DRAFT_505579 [Xylariaceae sp. AK1471]|nr:hypothetical protein HD806DRAFT_505579 [Xylariaceae sp. AK1471]